jgi:hypothetical protein
VVIEKLETGRAYIAVVTALNKKVPITPLYIFISLIREGSK